MATLGNQSFTQLQRSLSISTPLGEDALLITGLTGREAISELYRFRLVLLAEIDTKISFDQIIGRKVRVDLQIGSGGVRYFNGLVRRFGQGARDDTFTHYQAEIVPEFWLLTKKIRSRIFQNLSVPDILREVLGDLDVKQNLYEQYQARDYCVQYRESDFAFVSRLMEEEGIYYFFEQGEHGEQLVLSDNSALAPALDSDSTVLFGDVASGVQEEMRVSVWEKFQELRASEYTLRDYCFELPTNTLEIKDVSLSSIPVGRVTHALNAGNQGLEIYEYPGGYAKRFDGVDRGGNARPEDLQLVFEDQRRMARLRLEEEESSALEINGESDCGHFLPGHKFTLKRHFDAEDRYVITGVEHKATVGGYQARSEPAFSYSNHFTCVPLSLPYRPLRGTAKPVIAGVQTAVVVGPPGQDISCDKYGRVKVQFHWDREGRHDQDSSCWLRVAQVWAGSGWGSFFWPRVGNEVVVAFEEGDPDQPIIIGSVYNADNMPPFKLPALSELGGIKSASVRGRANQNFNAVIFNDHPGKEHLAIHSERNMSFNSEQDKSINAGRAKGERISVANVLTVGSLFGGGGSGGGFDEGNPVPEPAPVGFLGLNSQVCYGENFQWAIPMNHQMAFGDNMQVCINPLGLLAGVPGIPAAPVLTGIAGAAAGGNVQLTMGTNAQITMGQAININIGPSNTAITIADEYKNHIATCIVLGVMGAGAIAFMLAYGAMKPSDQVWENHNQSAEQKGDHERADLVLGYQIFIDACLITVIEIEMVFKAAHMKVPDDDVLKPLFRIGAENQSVDDTGWGGYSFLYLAAMAAAVIAPLESVGSAGGDR